MRASLPEPLRSLRPLRSLPSGRLDARIDLDVDGDHDALRMLFEFGSGGERLRLISADPLDLVMVRVDEIQIAGDRYSWRGQPDWVYRDAPATASVTDELGTFAWLVTPDLFLGMAPPEDLGPGQVEGHAVHGYRFALDSVRPDWLEQHDLRGLTDVRVDLWVSDEFGVPVTLDATLQGSTATSAGSRPLRISIEAHLTDVGEAVPIRRPAVCDSVALPDDIPLPESATHIGLSCGSCSLRLAAPAEQALADYHDLLTASGWLHLDHGSDPPVMYAYGKGQRRVLLHFDPSEEQTSIVLVWR